jgi:CubicO group peptidase (beta-lactamase class C family)
MKKWFKRFGVFILALILVLNLFVLLTGRFYLYKAVGNTYLQGRSGPSATEYPIFENHKVANGVPQPWPNGFDYNQAKIPAVIRGKMTAIGIGSFLIIQHDSIRYEEYWGEFNSKSYTNSFSMAKTVVSILVGCAIQEGKIKSVDQAVGDYIPEYKNGDFSKITIRHLLTMSSGIAFDESYANPLAYPAEAYYGNNLRSLTLQYNEMNESPGKTFRYLSGNTQLLGFVLQKATGQSVSDYASEKLWKPLGCEQSAFWSVDSKDNKNEKTFCCLNSNARDFARIGQLYLDSGRWKDNQIVSQEYAIASVRPSGLLRNNGKPCLDYGYSWWMIPNYKGHSIFYARGILGQYVLAIPDLDMIVVRLGTKRLPNDSDDVPGDVYYYLDAAFAMYGG